MSRQRAKSDLSLEEAAAGPLARTGSFSGGRDIGVVFNLPGRGGPSVLPGKTVPVTVTLGKPVALDVGQTFAIREGGRTVGAGTVTALLD